VFDTYGKKLNRNDALSALKLDQNCIYLLFFGFIRNYKGLDILIRAFSDSRLRGKNLNSLSLVNFMKMRLIQESGQGIRTGERCYLYDHFIETRKSDFFSAVPTW